MGQETFWAPAEVALHSLLCLILFGLDSFALRLAINPSLMSRSCGLCNCPPDLGLLPAPSTISMLLLLKFLLLLYLGISAVLGFKGKVTAFHSSLKCISFESVWNVFKNLFWWWCEWGLEYNINSPVGLQSLDMRSLQFPGSVYIRSQIYNPQRLLRYFCDTSIIWFVLNI